MSYTTIPFIGVDTSVALVTRVSNNALLGSSSSINELVPIVVALFPIFTCAVAVTASKSIVGRNSFFIDNSF